MLLLLSYRRTQNLLRVLAMRAPGLLARVSGSMKFRYNFKEVEAEQNPGRVDDEGLTQSSQVGNLPAAA